jgi:hypothetical protein
MLGFADLHTHPMAHLGFGGHFLWGEPSGPASHALRPCNSRNHGADFNILGVDVAQMALDDISRSEHGLLEPSPPPPFTGVIGDPQGAIHPADGFPTFRGWPTNTTICHQQMHSEWLRRAYEGGLRLMSALAVNNRLLSWIMEARHEMWDDDAIRAQLRAMQQFVILVSLPDSDTLVRGQGQST